VFGLLESPTHLLIGAYVLSLLLEEAAAGCVVLPTEPFPSHVQGTAHSWTSAAGKLDSVFSPLLFGLLTADVPRSTSVTLGDEKSPAE
jgi:hypothetical protein